MLEVELRNFFYLLSMNLSESHDSGHQFHMLPGLTRVIFLAIFLLICFQFHHSTLSCLELSFIIFFTCFQIGYSDLMTRITGLAS